MRIALAQILHPPSFEAGLETILSTIENMAGAAPILCFPENCVKGLRDAGFPAEALTREEHDHAIECVKQAAREQSVAVLLPMERPCERGWQNGAYVVSATGELLTSLPRNVPGLRIQDIDPSAGFWHPPDRYEKE